MCGGELFFSFSVIIIVIIIFRLFCRCDLLGRARFYSPGARSVAHAGTKQAQCSECSAGRFPFLKAAGEAGELESHTGGNCVGARERRTPLKRPGY